MSATAKQDGPPLPPEIQVQVEVLEPAKLATAALLVIRMSQVNLHYLQAVMRALAGKVPPGTPAVIVGPGKSIELLNAEQMGKYGWVRKPQIVT